MILNNIPSALDEVSLNGRSTATELEAEPSIRILPDVHVIKMGGQSIMDRGRPAVYPILDELVAARKEHDFIIGAGGGTRARHAYSLALDLEMPTGVLAAIGASTPRQNAWMMQMLLAKHGGIYVIPEDFEKLPLYFRLGCIPIMSGMPPFEYWEKIPAVGRIPPHRTDAGVYLTAEFLGAKSVLFIKDEDGLFTADPKKDPNAKHIPKAHVDELLEMNLGDLVVERVVLDYMKHAEHIRRIQIVNGLVPGNITRALAGEEVGTIIYA